VFKKGDAPDKFYIIEQGRAGMYLEGLPEPVLQLNPGDYFGERALFRLGNRVASVQAHEPLDVLAIGRESMQDVLAHLGLLRTSLEDRLNRLESSWKFRDLVRHHPGLNRVQVREAMGRQMPTMKLHMSFADAIEHFQRDGGSAYVVVDDTGLAHGLCTRTDLHNSLCALKPFTTPLTEIMSRPLHTIAESKSLAEAMQIFLAHYVNRLVVVADGDSGQPVGLITPFDILLHYTQASPEIMPGAPAFAGAPSST
jgi:signal-transduction protein with cAMP-binding, CBS, and nucleotidyltransferase domain